MDGDMTSENRSQIDGGLLFAARRIDPKGRCCGRKPIHYKRDGGPHLYCTRCSRAYHVETGEQIANWAFKVYDPTTFRMTYAHMAERMRNGQQ